MGRMIVDADVLIDATRNHPKALSFLEKNEAHIALSVVTLLELYAGIRTKTEETLISNLCNLFEKIDVNERIALAAGKIRHRYGKSHGTGAIDCIIAATAEAEAATLVTLNKKHYPMLGNVLIPYKKS